ADRAVGNGRRGSLRELGRLAGARPDPAAHGDAVGLTVGGLRLGGLAAASPGGGPPRTPLSAGPGGRPPAGLRPPRLRRKCLGPAGPKRRPPGPPAGLRPPRLRRGCLGPAGPGGRPPPPPPAPPPPRPPPPRPSPPRPPRARA